MRNNCISNAVRDCLRCMTIVYASFCFANYAKAADIYGVEVLADRYILRVLNTDLSAPVRDLAVITHQPQEELRSLLQLVDGRLGLLRTTRGDGGVRVTRLQAFVMQGQISGLAEEAVAGLDSPAMLSELLVAWSARYYALVSMPNDRSILGLATLQSGSRTLSITGTIELFPQARYANLTQCPDGRVFATSLAQEQDTRLVTLNLDSGQANALAPLTIEQRTLPSDVMSLACDVNGRLYALADPRRLGTASLFGVDPGTGVMTHIAAFPVHKIAFLTFH
jgi:hypothetical protein